VKARLALDDRIHPIKFLIRNRDAKFNSERDDRAMVQFRHLRPPRKVLFRPSG
jgi:hypothetical protein